MRTRQLWQENSRFSCFHFHWLRVRSGNFKMVRLPLRFYMLVKSYSNSVDEDQWELRGLKLGGKNRSETFCHHLVWISSCSAPSFSQILVPDSVWFLEWNGFPGFVTWVPAFLKWRVEEEGSLGCNLNGIVPPAPVGKGYKTKLFLSFSPSLVLLSNIFLFLSNPTKLFKVFNVPKHGRRYSNKQPVSVSWCKQQLQACLELDSFFNPIFHQIFFS